MTEINATMQAYNRSLLARRAEADAQRVVAVRSRNDHTATTRGRGDQTDAPRANEPATERQRRYLADLLVDRVHAWPTSDLAELEQLKFGRPCTKPEASLAIDYLLKQAKVERPNTRVSRDWPTVAPGRYAVPTDEGHLAFYRVAVSDTTGFVYVKVYASDAEHDVPFRAIGAILKKIAEDPTAAMIRFGQEIGRCGHCGRTLTDEDSRARGIGPICAGKLGL